jgi:hypothetical protein
VRTLVLVALAALASACPSPGRRVVVVDPSQVPSVNQTRWNVTHQPPAAEQRERR